MKGYPWRNAPRMEKSSSVKTQDIKGSGSVSACVHEIPEGGKHQPEVRPVFRRVG